MFKTVDRLQNQIKICLCYVEADHSLARWSSYLLYCLLFVGLMPLCAQIQIFTSACSIKLPSDILIRSDRYRAALLLISLRLDHYVN